MMKMLWVIAAAAVMLGPVGAPETVRPPKMGAEGFETLLPSGTVVYVSVRNVPECLTKIRQTPAYEVLSKEGFWGELLPPEAVVNVRSFWEKYVEPLGGILDGELAFALINFDGPGGAPAMVVLADVGGREAALERYVEEAILPVLREGRARTNKVTVGGVAVTRFVRPAFGGPGVLFGVKNGVLAISLGEEALEEVFGTLGGARGDTLKGDENFREVCKALGQADFMGYVNIEACLEKAREDAAEWGGEGQFDEDFGIFKAIAGFTKVRAGGMGIALGPDGGTTTMRVCCEGPRPGVFGTLARPAPALKSVKYVGEDAGCYMGYSFGSLRGVYKDLLGVFQAYDEAMGQGDAHHARMGVGCLLDFKRKVSVLEEALGMKLEEEVLPAFGGEVAVAGWVPEAVEIPPGVVMIEIEDKAAAKKVVARVLEVLKTLGGEEMAQATVKHKDVEITTIAATPTLTPAGAIVGDFLVVGTNAAAVKRVIDTAAGGKCLEENADWQRYVERLPGRATITMYVAVKRLVEFGRPVLAAKMQREGGGPGFGPSFAGLVIKALMELGECASGFGLKVVGDTGGVTVVSSSRHNGIGPVLVPVLTASLYSVRMDVRGGVEELPGPPPPPDRGGLIDEGEEFIGDELDLEELEEE